MGVRRMIMLLFEAERRQAYQIALIIDTTWPPVLASIASRSFFLIGELLLGNLSETVVVVGNTPHDRPGVLVGHLIGNRASFLCTKAPMLRIPETNFLHGIRSYWARCSGDLPPSPPASILRPNSVNR